MSHHPVDPARSAPGRCAVRSRRAVGVVLAVTALTAVAGLSTPAHAAGTDYFVSPTGVDTNSGTSAAAPFKTIQHALDLAQPGTTITLAAGTYREAATTKVAGAAGAPITVKGPETGKDPGGRYKAVLYSKGGRAFTINHSYYTLDGFTIDGQPNIALSEYPTSLDQVRTFKDNLQAQGRAINSKLVYVAAADNVSDLTGITVSNMFLNGSGGECLRFRNRTSNSLVVGSVIQNCGLYPSGDDSSKYKYHNGEGVYIGTSPKSTTEPFAANDTTNNIVVRDTTVHTFGSECFEVKENANTNRIENSDCGFNDEPLSWKGSNIELRGDHNTVLSTTVAQSRSWNVKMASDAPSYDLGGNTIQKSRFSGAAAPAIRDDQATNGTSFCGNTFSSTPVSEGSANMGDPAAPCADRTAPTAPTGVTAKMTSPSAVLLTWTAATDDVGVTTYNVLRDGGLVGVTSDLSFGNDGLAPATTYGYTVVALDAAGNASPPSPPVSVTTPPPAPTGVTATATSPTTVNLTWTAPAGVQVASYGVLRDGAQVGTPTTTSFGDTNLTPGTGYTYTVVARDTAGNTSPASATATVTTPKPPPAPTGLTATATSPTAVALSWTAPAGGAVASYGVLRNGTQVGTSTTTSYADSGLTASTAYSYTVVARDAAGTASPASTPATVTTPAPAPPTTAPPTTAPPTTAPPTTAPPTTAPPTTAPPTTAPPTTAPPAAKTITVEAESGAVTSPMAVRSDPAAQGGRYVSQTTGTTVGKDTMTATVPVAGRYALALRVLTPNSTSDSFTVTVDGGAATIWNLGTHPSWTWVTGPTLNLSAGSHRIVVSKRENGARLDAVRLTPAP